MAQVVLKAGHVQPVWAGHPWVFAQGIDKTFGQPEEGDEVEVRDGQGNRLGRGTFSSKSAIRVRLYSRNPDEHLTRSFFVRRFEMAEERRVRMGLGLPGSDTESYRLVYGEGDGLPGLVVDRFRRTLVLQFGSYAMHRRRELILDALEECYAPRAIYDRTSTRAATLEGFEARSGLVRGDATAPLQVLERGFEFDVPPTLAQKTGYYFDQRPLRARIEELARGQTVLDCYSYVGAIGWSAKRGGAVEVTCVDSSRPAIEAGETISRQLALEIDYVAKDAEKYLADCEQRGVVIVDPPKFAQRKSEQERALRAFRRVVALGVRATRSQGLLVVSSCSAALGIREVERALALAARERGREAFVLERLFQGPDHPVPAAFPEGLYLSTVIAQIP